MRNLEWLDNIIKDEPLTDEQKTIERFQTALFQCGEYAAEVENYKNIAEHQQSISMDRFFEIQRLREEIERLQKECDEAWEQHSESLVQYDLLFDEATALIENAKSEAVKEFAERLKDRMFNYYECVSESAKGIPYKGDTLMDYEVVDMIEDCIDNSVEEFTEGDQHVRNT